MKRRGNDARREDVLDGDRIVELGRRVQRRMPARGDGDLGELLGGSAVLVHVAHRSHGVVADHRRAVRSLEGVGRVAERAAAAVPTANRSEAAVDP